MVSVPIADAVVSEVIALPLVVILIVSVVFGKVNVPVVENVEPMCVWFIGVTPEVDACSCKTGSGDNSIPDDGDDVEVVVVLLPVVEAATRVVVDAKIIASVKIVATAVVVVARYVLCSRGIFLLLLLLFSVFIFRASGI
jgi:hypothetical protein